MPDRLRALIVSIAIATAVLLAYSRVWSFGFVHYDDNTHVFGQPHITGGLTAENVQWAFTHHNGAQWIPLTWVSLMADVSLFGLHPGAMHGMNVLIHAASAVLLFHVLRRMTGRFWPSAVVAAVFALHPVNVEGVAWVTERKNMLAGFFWLLATAYYVRFAENRRALWYVATAAAFACALMSKAIAVTFPLALLLLDAWPLQLCRTVPWRRLVLEKVPLLAITATACLIQLRAAAAEQAVWGGGGAAVLDFSYRAMNAGSNFLHYAASLLAPASLAPMYPFPKSTAWLGGSLGWLFAACIFAVGWRWRKAAPWLLGGWLWFLGTHFPVSGIVTVGDCVRADRHIYIPQLGLLVVLVWAAATHLPARAAKLATAVVLPLLGALTFLQTAHWRDTAALASHAAEVSPDSVVAHGLAGWAHANAGHAAKSIASYENALRLAPDLVKERTEMASILARTGQRERAIAEFVRALKADPAHGPARLGLGVQLFAIGETKNAIAIFSSLVAAEPHNATAKQWLARARELEARGK